MGLENRTEESGKKSRTYKKKIKYASPNFEKEMKEIIKEAEYIRKVANTPDWPKPDVYFKKSA